MSSAQKFAGGFALESMLYWIGYEVWRKDILAMVRWNVYNVTIYIAIFNEIIMHNCSRSLRWERGLKYIGSAQRPVCSTSFPSLGTWIEIVFYIWLVRNILSFPSLGTWIEIPPHRWIKELSSSFPSLGTWIEIWEAVSMYYLQMVVPFAGNVDWNRLYAEIFRRCFSRSLRWERGLK